jgi:hypothetical protein
MLEDLRTIHAVLHTIVETSLLELLFSAISGLSLRSLRLKAFPYERHVPAPVTIDTFRNSDRKSLPLFGSFCLLKATADGPFARHPRSTLNPKKMFPDHPATLNGILAAI